jgi:hypothetical protein
VAPRRRRTRRVGCWVEPTKGGRLRLRFRWRVPASSLLAKFSETTELLDGPENRELLQKTAAVIGAEIRAGTFDYVRSFPNGSRVSSFRGQKALSTLPFDKQEAPTVGRYYGDWIVRKTGPGVRASRTRDYRNHFRSYILDYMSEVVPLLNWTGYSARVQGRVRWNQRSSGGQQSGRWSCCFN